MVEGCRLVQTLVRTIIIVMSGKDNVNIKSSLALQSDCKKMNVNTIDIPRNPFEAEYAPKDDVILDLMVTVGNIVC